MSAPTVSEEELKELKMLVWSMCSLGVKGQSRKVLLYSKLETAHRAQQEDYKSLLHEFRLERIKVKNLSNQLQAAQEEVEALTTWWTDPVQLDIQRIKLEVIANATSGQEEPK